MIEGKRITCKHTKHVLRHVRVIICDRYDLFSLFWHSLVFQTFFICISCDITEARASRVSRCTLHLWNMTSRGFKSLTVSKPKNDLPTAGIRVLNIFPSLSSVTLFNLVKSCLTASVFDVIRDNSGDSLDPDGMVRRVLAASVVVSETIF